MGDTFSKRKFWFHKFEFLYYRILKFVFSIENPTDSFIRGYCGGNKCTNNYFGNSFEFIPTNDIGKKLFFNGTFESEEIQTCKSLINTDDIILDIGGNIGFHSVHFSQYSPKGLVYSFEPSPDTFKILSKNCKPFQNIHPINIGIGSSEGQAEFHYASDHAYSGFKDTGKKSILNTEKLPIKRLDTWVRENALERIDFIKIDVEGFEEHVLKGMPEVISKHKPVIFIEISPTKNQTENPQEIFNSLIKYGYEAFFIQNGILTRTENHLDTHHNYFFKPSRQRISL